MNREMQIILEVDNQAEIFYEDAVKLGDHAGAVLKRSRSQLTGLETIAESTGKTSDVFDYIKRQTARNASWRQTHRDSLGEGFGVRLKNYLEKDLGKSKDEICDKRLKIGNESEEDQRERRRIHLLLMRQFIRQMVVEYEFQVNIGEAPGQHSTQGRDAQRHQGSNPGQQHTQGRDVQRNQGNNKRGS